MEQGQGDAKQCDVREHGSMGDDCQDDVQYNVESVTSANDVMSVQRCTNEGPNSMYNVCTVWRGGEWSKWNTDGTSRNEKMQFRVYSLQSQPNTKERVQASDFINLLEANNTRGEGGIKTNAKKCQNISQSISIHL